MVQALRRAAETHGFEVQYQPIVDLATGVPTGLEALLAWPDAPAEWSGPTPFVPELERLGLMSRVTKETLERAVRDATEWPSLGGDRPSFFLWTSAPPTCWTPRSLAEWRTRLARQTLRVSAWRSRISERVTLDASGLVDSVVAV